MLEVEQRSLLCLRNKNHKPDIICTHLNVVKCAMNLVERILPIYPCVYLFGWFVIVSVQLGQCELGAEVLTFTVRSTSNWRSGCFITLCFFVPLVFTHPSNLVLWQRNWFAYVVVTLIQHHLRMNLARTCIFWVLWLVSPVHTRRKRGNAYHIQKVKHSLSVWSGRINSKHKSIQKKWQKIVRKTTIQN